MYNTCLRLRKNPELSPDALYLREMIRPIQFIRIFILQYKTVSCHVIHTIKCACMFIHVDAFSYKPFYCTHI